MYYAATVLPENVTCAVFLRSVCDETFFINMTTSGRWCDDGAVGDARARKGEIWGDRSEEVAVECTYWG